MTRKGYKSVTLSEEVVTTIDALIDVTKVDLNSRPKVIEKSIDMLKSQKNQEVVSSE